MGIKDLNNTQSPLYQGRHKPANFYEGYDKVTGWHSETQTGSNQQFENTYNDTADIVVKGNTIQKSEWVNKTGLLSQPVLTGKNIVNATNQIIQGNGGFVTLPNTFQGVTLSFENGGYKLNGITEAGQFPYWSLPINMISGQTYTLTIHSEQSTNVSFRVYNRTQSNQQSTVSTGSVTFTPIFNQDDNMRIEIVCGQNKTYATANIYIQLELGATVTPYEPYCGGIPAPNPAYPQPITSNLPASTYKVKDWRGDWYEFTIDKDLGGIDGVLDSVEFDKYGHRGFERRGNGTKVLNGTEEYGVYATGTNYLKTAFITMSKIFTGAKSVSKGLSSHFIVYPGGGELYSSDTEGIGTSSGEPGKIVIKIDNSKLVTADAAGFKSWLQSNNVTVYYQLATPTRTPLTFTLNNSSTAPELPMEFLTDTPSEEYPAEVWDGGGIVGTGGKNLLDITRTELGAFNQTTGEKITGIGSQVRTTYPIKLSQGQAIVYSTSSTYNGRIFVFDLLNTYINTVPLAPNGFYTATTDCILYIVSSSLGFTLGFTFQYEYGTQATVFQPFKPLITTQLPTLRKVNTTADEYYVKSKKIIRKNSGWVSIDNLEPAWGSLSTKGYSDIFFNNLSPKAVIGGGIMYKYDNTAITKKTNFILGFSAANQFAIYASGTDSRVGISVSKNDSGWGDMISPTVNEIKSYFYGHQMCHSDGRTPYYKSETPYNPTTWAELAYKAEGTVQDGNLILIFNNSSKSLIYTTQLKPNTKYGSIQRVYENTTNMTWYSRIGGTIVPANTTLITPYQTGIIKSIGVTPLEVTNNTYIIGTNTTTTGTSVIGEIRLYELPSGSQIEADFNALTADELSIKYPFDGLNQKHWKHIVGTEAEKQASITPVLPTESYEGYTPYKMCYELETPVEEYFEDGTVLPTYYPSTVIQTTHENIAEAEVTATIKVEDE